jgi:hypothetical protein
MNSSQEIPGELVVSGGDAAEVLEPAKAALDDISALVGAFIEAMNDDAVGFVWDYGLGAATNDFTAKVVTVIPFVGEERTHGRRERQNIGRGRDIGILAWGQMQDDRPAERIAQRTRLARGGEGGGKRSAATPRVSNHAAIGCAAIVSLTLPRWENDTP